MSTPSRSASARASALGRTLKPIDERVRGRREVHVVLGDPADAGVDHVDAHLGVLDLAELAEERLDRALHVALEDDVEILDDALLHLGEQASRARRRAWSAARAARGGAARPRFWARSLAWRSCSTTRASSPAGGGRSKPRISTGSPGRASLTFSPLVVVERAHLAGRVARDDRVADVQRAALDEHRRDRAAADVEARLDDRAGRLGGRVRAQVELGVGDEQHLLEQLVEVRASAWRRPRRTGSCRPTPPAAALRRRARSGRGRGWRSARRSC